VVDGECCCREGGTDATVRRVLGVWLSVVLVEAVCAGRAAADGSTGVRPNVLFIMADDYRAELGALGSAARTPNLDRPGCCVACFSACLLPAGRV
jgi:hypothetical protein